MTQTRDELGYGGVDMTLPLRRVMVRPPAADSVVAWRAFGWRGEPDAARIAEEHEGLRQQLADAGAEVVVAQTPVPMSPDAIYVFDPALVTNDGALLLRPGKEGRRAEVEAMAVDFVEAGVPIAGRLEGPATVEGGDTLWLDSTTLLVGRGYRTNQAGVTGLTAALPRFDRDPVRPAALARRGRGAPPHVADLHARHEPGGRLPAAHAGSDGRAPRTSAASS